MHFWIDFICFIITGHSSIETNLTFEFWIVLKQLVLLWVDSGKLSRSKLAIATCPFCSGTFWGYICWKPWLMYFWVLLHYAAKTKQNCLVWLSNKLLCKILFHTVSKRYFYFMDNIVYSSKQVKDSCLLFCLCLNSFNVSDAKWLIFDAYKHSCSFYKSFDHIIMFLLSNQLVFDVFSLVKLKNLGNAMKISLMLILEPILLK